jgi:hypothetical protein
MFACARENFLLTFLDWFDFYFFIIIHPRAETPLLEGRHNIDEATWHKRKKNVIWQTPR